MRLNITTKLLSLFVTATLALTACGDKADDAQPNLNLTGCKVTEVTDSEGSISEIEYNAAGYITGVTQVEVDGEDEYVFSSKFTYDANNRLIKDEFFEDGELSGYNTYEYANGLVSKSKSYYNNALQYTATYVYDDNKRVTAINETGTDSDVYKMTFKYNSAGNVIETKSTHMGEVYMTKTFENYDEKFTPVSAVSGLVNLYEGSSKNNPGKVTETYYWSETPEVNVINYSYEYNAKNLPTKITETDKEGETYTSNFTYQCK